MDASPLTRSVQFFTGKGGVGKSTVLSAVAIAAAKAGKQPLIVELGMHTSSSHLLDGPEVGYEPSEIAPGIHATRVLFEPALIDYVTSRLKLRAIAVLVATNNSLRRLFLAAPGVDEIVTLHRVAQLTNEQRWDPVLVDLESTGHALMFFDLPGVLEVFLRDGPLRQVLDSATRLIRDESRCAIHVVTVPEPLAVRETVQLYEGLLARKDLHLGYLFVNRVPRRWLDEEEQRLLEEELERVGADQPWVADLALADYFVKRRRTAEKCLRGLRHDIGLPMVFFDEQDAGSLAVIEAISHTLQRLGAW